MSLDDSTLVRVILILVAVWLALNVIDEIIGLVGDFLGFVANSFILSVIVLVLILWYLDII